MCVGLVGEGHLVGWVGVLVDVWWMVDGCIGRKLVLIGNWMGRVVLDFE